MNNISQISVFDYSEIEILGDLERIKLFFENLDDKELCESLENERKNGRNRAHIMCDAKYGLPIAYNLTPANNSEQIELDNLIKDLNQNEKEKYKLEKMENLMGDAGYDNGKRNKKLKEEYNINPVFDINHIWNKDEKYKEIDNMPIAYNEDGEVFYIVDINNYEKMKYLGYDKKNNALRYTRQSTGRKIYRIPLSIDYRIFVPIARDSKKFKTKYKMRTEVERLNGRLDRDYMFNDHFIRGLKKMETMLDLSFLVMLTMAKGHIINNQANIRSLVA